MTTRIFIGILVFLAVGALVAVVGLSESARMENYDEAHQGRSIETGAALFEDNCVGCHGVQGKGIATVGPALNDYHFFAERLDEIGFSGSMRSYIAGTIAAGRPVMSADWPAPMPTWGQAYGGPLREDQVENLTDYVLNWQEAALAAGPVEPTAPADVTGDPLERGMNLFVSKGCGGCHVIEGLEGAQGQVGPEMTDIATVAEGRVEDQSAEAYIRTSILNPGAFMVQECPLGPCSDVMPKNFAETLSEQELDDIVTYLLSLE